MQKELSFHQKRGNQFIDRTGQVFGWLTALEYQPGKRARWKCKCKCGEIVSVLEYNLTNESTKSCGCFRRMLIIKRCLKHGCSRTSMYSVWCGMKQRCSDTSHVGWKHYGGRGITVCQRWENSFEAFFQDMGDRPSPKHMIERLDNNKGYEPGNCVWRTRSEQMNNTRRNHWLTFNGQRHTVAQWCNILNVKYGLVEHRIRRGWDAQKALTLPKIKGRPRNAH